MIKMRLSKRLKAITEFVDKEDRIIDIGCDHALLDIYIKENINLFKDKIIISDEISSGIVPLKKEDRMWREETGRCLQYLSKESSCVYRVFCGISTIIKS